MKESNSSLIYLIILKRVK